jgi:hypothetical protein
VANDPPPGANSDKVGLPYVTVQPDSHLTTYFSTEAGRLRIAVPFLRICQYDVREFDGPSLLEAIKAHPDVSELGLVKFVS